MGQAAVDSLDAKKNKQKRFLAAYAKTGIVAKAAQAAGISRQTYYDWYDTDDEFREAAKEAKQAAIDAMEHEAWRRAVKGTLKPVYYKGKKVGHIREYSDTLLIFLLKANNPDKYKEHVVNELKSDGLTIIIGDQQVTGK